MSWLFKPKGLRFGRRRTQYLSLGGGPHYALTASFKTKGRLGAKGRSAYQCADEYTRSRMLEAWHRGHAFEWGH